MYPGDSFLNIGVTCKSFSVQLLLQVSKGMEITECKTEAVGRVVHNLLVLAVTSLVGSMGASDCHIFGPLTNQLDGKQFATHDDMK
jgi:hypothetical protein